MDGLLDFMTESLKMDRVLRSPLIPEMQATESFINLVKPKSADILDLALSFDRRVEFRDRRGMHANIGTYRCPAGGQNVIKALDKLLTESGKAGPFETHIRFNALQPLTAVNGIVGRVLWLSNWIDLHPHTACPYSFLRTWYHESIRLHLPPPPKVKTL